MKIQISLLILLFIVSCKTDLNMDVNSLIKLDSEKTYELISQILKDENNNYLISSCISEQSLLLPTSEFSDFNKSVNHNLNIRNTKYAELQFDLYKKFKITNDLVPDKNIITKGQFEEFNKKSEKDEFKFWILIGENCTNGYSFITKPVFNESLDLAYIEIGNGCGGLCGSGEERIYEFIKGKWILKKVISSWIS